MHNSTSFFVGYWYMQSALKDKYDTFLKQAKHSNGIVHIITANDLKKKDITTDNDENTQNLNGYCKPWFFENGNPDLDLTSF